jgi:hypothetical protein
MFLLQPAGSTEPRNIIALASKTRLLNAYTIKPLGQPTEHHRTGAVYNSNV